MIDAGRSGELSLSIPQSYPQFELVSPLLALYDKTRTKNGWPGVPVPSPRPLTHVIASHHRRSTDNARGSGGEAPRRHLHPLPAATGFQAGEQRTPPSQNPMQQEKWGVAHLIGDSPDLMQQEWMVLLRRDTFVQSVQQEQVIANGPPRPAHWAKTHRPTPLHREMASAHLHRARRYPAIALLILWSHGR